MDDTKYNKYTHRYLSRIVLEAMTPMAVGSGERNIETDSLVATDINDLPYIPGTSIAGVVRSMLERVASKDGGISKEDVKKIFGYQDGENGRGSEVIFSEAKIMGGAGRVIDGLDRDTILTDELLKHYQLLPIRQHVRIDGRGTAMDSGLFDEQIVFAGSRFCFEMEMVSDGTKFSQFESILRQLYAVDFRIGGGTRSGFGEMRVVDMLLMDLDLTKRDDLDVYLGKTSALDSGFWTEHIDRVSHLTRKESSCGSQTCYRLTLTPDSFFLFGSGFGDDDADMTPVKAKRVEWNEKIDESGAKITCGRLLDNLVLIPGSSLKGAIAHRVAFHWNRMHNIFADDIPPKEIDAHTGSGNEAVRLLFGMAGEGAGNEIRRGNVIFSDIIGGRIKDKVLNHVAIDRFTGGGIEGALFSEKAVWTDGVSYNTDIIVDEEGLLDVCVLEFGEEKADEKMAEVKRALTYALDDLCNGMLPLGGGVNRGHGIFKGKYETLKQNHHGSI